MISAIMAPAARHLMTPRTHHAYSSAGTDDRCQRSSHAGRFINLNKAMSSACGMRTAEVPYEVPSCHPAFWGDITVLRPPVLKP